MAHTDVIPCPTPIEGVEVEDETDFFNWYNPAKAHRVLTVNVPDPILKMKTIGRLIWWNQEQTIPQSLAYVRADTSHAGIKF